MKKSETNKWNPHDLTDKKTRFTLILQYENEATPLRILHKKKQINKQSAIKSMTQITLILALTYIQWGHSINETG